MVKKLQPPVHNSEFGTDGLCPQLRRPIQFQTLNKTARAAPGRGTMSSDDREFQNRKSELEEKLQNLEMQRATLIEEVRALREKRTLLDLERKATSLQQIVDSMQKEKEDLQGQVASLEAGQGQG